MPILNQACFHLIVSLTSWSGVAFPLHGAISMLHWLFWIGLLCSTGHFRSTRCTVEQFSCSTEKVWIRPESSEGHCRHFCILHAQPTSQHADNTGGFQPILVFSLWRFFFYAVFTCLSDNSLSSSSDKEINETTFNTACKRPHFCPITS